MEQILELKKKINQIDVELNELRALGVSSSIYFLQKENERFQLIKKLDAMMGLVDKYEE